MSEDKKKNNDSKKEEETAKHVVMDTKTASDMVIIVKGEEGREYKFSMPFKSPLPECYNASVNVANEIAKLFNEAVKRQAEAEKEKAKKDTSVEEEKKAA